MKKLLFGLILCLTSFAVSAQQTVVSVQIRQDTNDHLGLVDALLADPVTKDTVIKQVVVEATASQEKIQEIRKEILGYKPSVIFISNTGPAVAVLGTIENPNVELRKLPIVLSSVTNPVVAKLTNEQTTNIVGTIHVGKPSLVLNQLQRSLEKRISSAAILITEDEIPARSWGEELNSTATDYKIQSKIIFVSKKEGGLEQAVEQAVGNDIIIVGPDTYLASNNPVKLSSLALEKRLPVLTVTFNPIQVKDSKVLYSISANGKAVGLDAGEKVKRILKGENTTSMQIEPIKQITLFYREDVYEQFGLKLKSTALENAQKIKN